MCRTHLLFQVYKCSDSDCKFHKQLRGDAPSPLGDPVPYTREDGVTHYQLGTDPEEKFLPSKLEDITKQVMAWISPQQPRQRVMSISQLNAPSAKSRDFCIQRKK